MTKKTTSAINALEEAHKIAFAPFVFQSSVSLKKLGVLTLIFEHRKKGGLSIEEISEQLSISTYGLGVLLEIAESANLVEKTKEKYSLTKTGYFLNFDKTVAVNLNFTNDVCYEGLYHLNEAIKNEKPEGLKVFGDWDTIYEGLSELEPETQKSWFEFDHHYSDGIFEEALDYVFRNNPKTIFDIGGNTGKFALHCLRTNPSVAIKIFDLPGQLNKALKTIEAAGFKNRVSGQSINWLLPTPEIKGSPDVIWMSQFLDCFSESEIITILSTCVKAMTAKTELIIVETFTDRQKFEKAKFALEATSLYFTALANGTSKMYPANVFKKLIEKAGLTLTEDHPLGDYHTLLVCKKRD
ncbi:SAM-dependent methyltransferase [Bizionia gelidisalsuginis]|uniref:SAM-dependent methyltransferase n=2 Tax=Bizionia TaxID=283785 RepID=A0A8H2QF30_9FLAO|nr:MULTISPECIES: methyltransferase [Bizionia]TYB74097.1 SAM-dependent methyltransferase [Bizionia saleffrena]TYC15545.1 SAM-dependent methyltransferase [Bizionia gelidisalsuginis]